MLLCLLLGSCDASGQVGQVELALHDAPVTCDAAHDSCLTKTGEPALTDEYSRTQAFISEGSSQYGPGRGLYLYFELQRPRGVLALVEIDIPTAQVGPDAPAPILRYTELLQGQTLFRSQQARARIEVLAAGSSCSCTDGRLEVQFSAPGEDGVMGTEDDQVRRLSRGRFGAQSGAFCRNARLLDLPSERPLEVAAIHGCPASSSAAPAGVDYGDETAAEAGCYMDDESYAEEDTGCGYEGDDGSYDEDSGCDGDTSDYDYDDDSGCAGDTSDYDYDSDSAGCDGDDSSAAACEGDAYAAMGPRGSRVGTGRRRRGSKLLGMALPMMLLGGFLGTLRHWDRRRRRQRRRR